MSYIKFHIIERDKENTKKSKCKLRYKYTISCKKVKLGRKPSKFNQI